MFSGIISDLLRLSKIDRRNTTVRDPRATRNQFHNKQPIEQATSPQQAIIPTGNESYAQSRQRQQPFKATIPMGNLPIKRK